jgi:pantetheine-phosphate adenylyltransferase
MEIKVCVAGTFNVIHSGHLALLKKAFESGDEVFIGLTSDAMASKGRDVQVRSYASRKNDLLVAVKKFSGGKEFHVIQLDDEYGPAVSEDYDAIVVSRFTKKTAEKINGERKKRGLRSLKIIEIDLVLAEDRKPITSTRVISGEISENGKIK